MTAKPFLKWAGGKTQLIGEIEKALPGSVYKEKFTYIEPFVGSGAVLFWMLNNFQNLKKAVINDINADLINTYRVIASYPNCFHSSIPLKVGLSVSSPRYTADFPLPSLTQVTANNETFV
ncbi:MAG: Modification methylase DpnIIA [Bacteroidetes bacterium ADurb.Bin141]|nr:MAG: Modification methylase DpnIIA [Bacteroidetes bacterium ADurb.Bin141]